MRPRTSDFSRAPFIAIWETTRSCALVCRHCRAEAEPGRDPSELNTAEGKDLLTQASAMGTPIFVLSGGDPLERPDLEELVVHGKSLGLRMGTIPAATRSLTRERVRRLRRAGLDQLALSLDAPSARAHDKARGVPGSFKKTLEAARFVREEGIPLQVNTCFASWNIDLLEEMSRLVTRLGVVFWEVFFLVPVGRGRELECPRPERFEEAFESLHRLARRAPFTVKVAEAQHYRRFVIRKERAANAHHAKENIRRLLARPRGVDGGIGLSPETVNAGKGFVFVDYAGNICPSGFLSVPAGNIRRRSLAETYRDSPLFRELRDPRRLKGKCGACEFARECGGSRARAWALTGDWLGSDPCCAYLPETWRP